MGECQQIYGRNLTQEDSQLRMEMPDSANLCGIAKEKLHH